MPEYIVFVMRPYGPHGDAGPFDIPEWDLGAATATANRYRERGWEACVIDCGTRDGARIRARAVGGDRTGSRRMG